MLQELVLWIFAFLGAGMIYIGLHLHRPMFWEDGGFIDKIKDKFGL